MLRPHTYIAGRTLLFFRIPFSFCLNVLPLHSQKHMRTGFYQTTIYPILIILTVFQIPNVHAAPDRFKIQVLDGEAKMSPPYMLISGKQYRLEAISSDKEVLSAEWFLSGNLGSITTSLPPILTTIFVGMGELICHAEGVKQRVKLNVVPATKIIGSNGGKLQSPAGVVMELPESALATEEKIGIEIVAPPGLPPTPQRFVRVIRISPEKLVLKRPGQLTFLYPRYVSTHTREASGGLTDAKPLLYFWETFGKRWVPLQGHVDAIHGGVTTPINHFGIYTVMAAPPETVKQSEQLQIQNVTLSPRVFFASDRNRLTIAYQLTAPEATRVFVTMEIFDLRGRRVRQLLENAYNYTGQNAAQWDGLTDDGSLAKNGRYLLIIRARTGGQQVGYRKLIVVFK